MLEGKTPFVGKTPTETSKNIIELRGLNFKYCTDENAQDLIKSLLKLEPEMRIGSISFD